MVNYPGPPRPLPTIDVLILRALCDEHQTSARSIAEILGEHHSNVATWLEKFVKQGLAERYKIHRGRDRENTILYAPVRNRITEYLEGKISDKRPA